LPSRWPANPACAETATDGWQYPHAVIRLVEVADVLGCLSLTMSYDGAILMIQGIMRIYEGAMTLMIPPGIQAGKLKYIAGRIYVLYKLYRIFYKFCSECGIFVYENEDLEFIMLRLFDAITCNCIIGLTFARFGGATDPAFCGRFVYTKLTR